MELVPQSTAPTRVTRAAASGDGSDSSATQEPDAHQSSSASSASSPSGLTPGPAAREWATRTCRHLTRVGMPPADTPAISATSPELGTPGQVVLVRRGVAASQVLVLGQPGGHLAHHPGGLEGRDGTGQLGAGRVVGRGERRPVGQPRLGGEHVRAATGAPVGDRCDAAGQPAELGVDRVEVGLGGALTGHLTAGASDGGTRVRDLHRLPELAVPGWLLLAAGAEATPGTDLAAARPSMTV